METMTDILADTKRYRDEAVALMSDLRSGRKKIVPGTLSLEEAIRVLEENIATYDRTLANYGRDHA